MLQLDLNYLSIGQFISHAVLSVVLHPACDSNPLLDSVYCHSCDPSVRDHGLISISGECVSRLNFRLHDATRL